MFHGIPSIEAKFVFHAGDSMTNPKIYMMFQGQIIPQIGHTIVVSIYPPNMSIVGVSTGYPMNFIMIVISHSLSLTSQVQQHQQNTECVSLLLKSHIQLWYPRKLICHLTKLDIRKFIFPTTFDICMYKIV